MPLSSLAGKPPRWLRLALAGVALVFALDVLAAGLHDHDADTGPCHTTPADCDYCLTFTGLMSAPAAAAVVPPPIAAGSPVAIPVTARMVSRPRTSAQPRAPPAR